MMGLLGCSCPNQTTLKLSSIPTFSFLPFLFKNSTFSFHKSPLPRSIKALSSAIVRTATPKAPQDQGRCQSFFSFTLPAELNNKKTNLVLAGVKLQWKATVDFKWIKDNKEAVAANLRNRNSDADLDLVLHLYDEMLTLQKVMSCYVSLRFFSSSLNYQF